MILKLALRNIIGNGWRSLINMIIIAIVMIGMIWMQAMYHSWIRLAETEARDWEIGSGQLHHVDYDRYDAFSWDSSFAEIPAELRVWVDSQDAVPILLSPAVIYPQGRMTSVLVKGIPREQTLLSIPTEALEEDDEYYIPAIVGPAMASNNRLAEGDIVTMRLKDAHGSFNALDLKITRIMNTPVPTTDAGQIWIDLDKLQEIKDLHGNASIVVLSEKAARELGESALSSWKFMSPRYLLADLYKVMETETGQQNIMFALLLFLAMIAIFDTQILALFKRRREIGTLSALGMQKSRIIALFTLEGILYMVFSIFFTAVLGFPIFWYFAKYGYRIPQGFDSFGMAGMSDVIRFQYPISIILGTIVFVFVLTAIVSWIPSARIARMNPTDALRGKAK